MREVLMFCISDKVSGGEIYTIELLSGLVEIGWTAHIVGVANSGLEEAVRDRGIDFVPTRLLGPKLGRRTALRLMFSWATQIREFRRIIREYPDATIILQYKLEQLVWAFISDSRQCLYLEHGPIPNMVTMPIVRWFYRRGLRKTKATLAASSPAADALRRLGADPHLIAAGVDDNRREMALAQVDSERRRLRDLTGSDLVGVYAGRITAEKGILDAARICMQSSRLGLVIYGTGPQLDELLSIVEGSTKVKYLGVVADALPSIAASDFSILLTRDPGEGRPLFGIESISVGTPLVGLVGSAATMGLQAEFGLDCVRLISRASVECFEAVIMDLPKRVTAMVPTWRESSSIVSGMLESTSRGSNAGRG